jgi:hypothetical protein
VCVCILDDDLGFVWPRGKRESGGGGGKKLTRPSIQLRRDCSALAQAGFPGPEDAQHAVLAFFVTPGKWLVERVGFEEEKLSPPISICFFLVGVLSLLFLIFPTPFERVREWGKGVWRTEDGERTHHH